MRKHSFRHQERGMALLIALLALLLISAVGMGMIYMSDTETTVNTNYRDTQLAFFSMRGGLEEMRDRMRTNAPSTIAAPTVMPGTAGSIIYITNPAGGGDTVDPKTSGTTYFDDEYCHEEFNGTGGYGANNTCASHAPPSGSVAAYVASISPYTNTTSAVKYKWVRVTLKQNSTFPNNLVAPIDASHPASGQVCWSTSSNQEVVVNAFGYTNCQTAFANGVMVEPVYVITSFAYTPAGSRRIGQYETAALSITPPASGLALDGPGSAANFTPPNSNNGSVNGNDGASSPSGVAPPAVPGCSTVAGASVPAIGTSDWADQTGAAADVPSGRYGNYVGTDPAFPGIYPPTLSIVDMGSDAQGTNQLTNWSSVSQLITLTNLISNGADATYTCPIVGGSPGKATACTGTYGTVANPQITYINGDAIVSGGAGVLVVTGTLYFTGAMQFDGLILVIGQGAVYVDGGAASQIFGSVFVAQTNSTTSPFGPLGTLGTPSFTWNGGGKAAIMYNSCWANIGNGLHYMVVASREEMY
jgi:Tfp pilus assembly protein PilV